MTTATKSNQIFKTMIWIFLSITISIYMMNMETVRFPTKSALKIISFQGFQSISIVSVLELCQIFLSAAIFAFIGFTEIDSASRTKTLFTPLFSYACKFIRFLSIILIASVNTILTSFLPTNIWLFTTNFTQSFSISFTITGSSPYCFFAKAITAFCMTVLDRTFTTFVTNSSFLMIFSPFYPVFAAFISACLTGSEISIFANRATRCTQPIRNSFFSTFFMSIHRIIIAQNKQISNFILPSEGNIYA